MDMMQIRLGLALKDAGIEISMDAFDKRLSLQKIVYLLREAGVPVSYKYNWYLRGPYSPDLAEDLFSMHRLEDKGEGALSSWTYDEEVKGIIGDLKPLLENEGPGLPKARWLELLASVLFLFRTRQAKPSDLPGIQKILKVNEKEYTDKQVTEGIGALREYGFLTP